MPDADTLRHALHLLLHDLRAPISVAVGFVRLLRENRLPDDESRSRALAQTTDALGRLSGLCDTASDLLGVLESPRPPAGRCPLDRVVGAVVGSLGAGGLDAVAPEPPPGRWTVEVARTDLLASRVAAIAAATRGHTRGAAPVAHLDVREGWLRVRIGPAAALPALDRGAPVGLETGRDVNLPVMLACLDIARHGGRAWTTDEAWPAFGVALPVQEDPS